MYCLKCGYALDGLAEKRSCPECGRPFDPKYPQTWSDGTSRAALRRLAIRLTIIFFIGWLIYAVAINPAGQTRTWICQRCAAVEKETEWWIPLTEARLIGWRTAEPSPTHEVLKAHAIRTDCGHQWAFCGGNEWGWRGCRLYVRRVMDFRDAAADPTVTAFFKHLAQVEPPGVVEAWLDYAFAEIPDDLQAHDFSAPTYRLLEPSLRLLLLIEGQFPASGFDTLEEFKSWWATMKNPLTADRDFNLARIKAAVAGRGR